MAPSSKLGPVFEAKQPDLHEHSKAGLLTKFGSKLMKAFSRYRKFRESAPQISDFELNLLILDVDDLLEPTTPTESTAHSTIIYSVGPKGRTFGASTKIEEEYDASHTMTLSRVTERLDSDKDVSGVSIGPAGDNIHADSPPENAPGKVDCNASLASSKGTAEPQVMVESKHGWELSSPNRRKNTTEFDDGYVTVESDNPEKYFSFLRDHKATIAETEALGKELEETNNRKRVQDSALKHAHNKRRMAEKSADKLKREKEEWIAEKAAIERDLNQERMKNADLERESRCAALDVGFFAVQNALYRYEMEDSNPARTALFDGLIQRKEEAIIRLEEHLSACHTLLAAEKKGRALDNARVEGESKGLKQELEHRKFALEALSKSRETLQERFDEAAEMFKSRIYHNDMVKVICDSHDAINRDNAFLLAMLDKRHTAILHANERTASHEAEIVELKGMIEAEKEKCAQLEGLKSQVSMKVDELDWNDELHNQEIQDVKDGVIDENVQLRRETEILLKSQSNDRTRRIIAAKDEEIQGLQENFERVISACKQFYNGLLELGGVNGQPFSYGAHHVEVQDWDREELKRRLKIAEGKLVPIYAQHAQGLVEKGPLRVWMELCGKYGLGGNGSIRIIIKISAILHDLLEVTASILPSTSQRQLFPNPNTQDSAPQSPRPTRVMVRPQYDISHAMLSEEGFDDRYISRRRNLSGQTLIGTPEGKAQDTSTSMESERDKLISPRKMDMNCHQHSDFRYFKNVSRKQVKTDQGQVRKQLRDGCILCLFGSHINFTASRESVELVDSDTSDIASILTAPEQGSPSEFEDFHIPEEEGSGLYHVFPTVDEASIDGQIEYPEYHCWVPMAEKQLATLANGLEKDDHDTDSLNLHVPPEKVVCSEQFRVAQNLAAATFAPEEGCGLGHVYNFLNHRIHDEKIHGRKEGDNLPTNAINIEHPLVTDKELGLQNDESHSLAEEVEKASDKQSGEVAALTASATREETQNLIPEEEGFGLAHVFPFLNQSEPEEQSSSSLSVASVNNSELDNLPIPAHKLAAASKAMTGFLSAHQAVIEQQAAQHHNNVSLSNHRLRVLEEAGRFLGTEAKAREALHQGAAHDAGPSQDIGAADLAVVDDKTTTSMRAKNVASSNDPLGSASLDLGSLDSLQQTIGPRGTFASATNPSFDPQASNPERASPPAHEHPSEQQSEKDSIKEVPEVDNNPHIISSSNDDVQPTMPKAIKNDDEQMEGFPAPRGFHLWERLTPPFFTHRTAEDISPSTTSCPIERDDTTEQPADIMEARHVPEPGKGDGRTLSKTQKRRLERKRAKANKAKEAQKREERLDWP
ncbi:MAG: hypothetical protein Q9217_001908 [Psora testacea]